MNGNAKFIIHQTGMSLIEVLIALVVMAVGMLGIAGMLILSNKANNSSYAKQQAVQCIYDIFDKIRANSQAAINGNYNISNINSSGSPVLPAAPGVLCNQSPCSSPQLAAYDTWYWLTYDVSRLPNGSGSITSSPAPGTGGNTIITVTVQWDDSLAQNEVGASSTASPVNPNYVQLSIQSQL
ncbi:type IV pilus modification protein PilV [Fluoribacter dumoffii]|uniref:Tfp pilus assembly protein PilV n=1 Tax=Fluoribacter dumoffii TaxID=463 RepID=A0A377GCR1_9GAMM|nr:type IV pilus modification protein PilV [Fluoribacter dumoffii]KTC90717.1 pre-pilin leader sequence (pilV) [Fluoribacter dumoffii NY 23]MCW8419450.1 type IV pilus modification protein PilV [Fluoribacter dumoffii]MCW8452675.1 type IV pilus modification protein PilV [Fluoribacter dumoffii]MCW8460075.1 type IV pilus modification protein PilV [Fluoribacter dumoffii]MCW8483553.1 type IV pilus modification protein PilV [Fluoribacter dumoffii]